MLIKKQALAEIKNIAKNDIILMDQLIENRLNNCSNLIKDITSHIIKSGGKRLRPLITILVSKLYNYQGSRHINLAAAVEFIHTATLLHDDVVDNSKMRRGKITANKFWDNKSCILVGDYLFSQAFVLMSEDRDLEVLNSLSRASAVIAEGEVKQLESISNLNHDISDYLEIIAAKTAELFAASAKVGAIVANSSAEIINLMYEFGLNIGMAFQIIDDILDYEADESDLGKSVGDDFKEGKVTLPIIYLLKKCQESELRVIKDIFSNTPNNVSFELTRSLMKKYDVMSDAKKIAKSYLIKASEILSHAPDNRVRASLELLLDFSFARDF